MPRNRKPQPVSKSIVCSECGLAWDMHKEATLAECVRLLRSELAKRPSFSILGSSSATSPWGMVNITSTN